MALVKCKDCRGKLSTKATTCPHCGAPAQAPTSQGVSQALGGCLGSLICLGLSWFICSGVLSVVFSDDGATDDATGSDGPQQRTVQVEPVANALRMGLQMRVSSSRDEPSAALKGDKLLADDALLPKRERREPEVVPRFEVVDEEVHDVSGKTSIERDLLILEPTTEAALRALLKEELEQARSRRGFQFNTAPTIVAIRAFDTREKAVAGQGGFVGMVIWGGVHQQPNFRIKKERIAHCGMQPEQKGGLSEAKRQEVFRECIRAEDIARERTDKAYPYSSLQELRAISDQRNAYEKRVELEMLKEVGKRYELSQEQLEEITSEGIRKNWVMPEID